MNSREIMADIAAMEKAADLIESSDPSAAKRLRRMARDIRANVLLIGRTKRSAPITEFERKLIDQS